VAVNHPSAHTEATVMFLVAVSHPSAPTEATVMFLVAGKRNSKF